MIGRWWLRLDCQEVRRHSDFQFQIFFPILSFAIENVFRGCCSRIKISFLGSLLLLKTTFLFSFFAIPWLGIVSTVHLKKKTSIIFTKKSCGKSNFNRQLQFHNESFAQWDQSHIFGQLGSHSGAKVNFLDFSAIHSGTKVQFSDFLTSTVEPKFNFRTI